MLLKSKPPKDWPTEDADYQKLDWFGRSNPIAVLPSVAALRGLRSGRATASAPLPFVGFGDPALEGSLDCRSPAFPSECPHQGEAPIATMTSRGVVQIDSVRRNGHGAANLDSIRALCPLPETATKLRCVAESLKAPASTVHTGAQATVTMVENADLAQYRIIQFATHGLLAGDMQTDNGVLDEPALVLTPPARPQPGKNAASCAPATFRPGFG